MDLYLPTMAPSGIATEQQPLKTPRESVTSDPQYRIDVLLGKKIRQYNILQDLGCGSYSKVKLGIHNVTKANLMDIFEVQFDHLHKGNQADYRSVCARC
ncbi:unnamed protein product [Soboliphyme baturini]|uniref:Protein kinase domain-containing protein n=1 Tax=Soboliphyme baturini TaxID=241478 RepID=A0A183J019_9BILA|nr:unnamed protein product [Soboliphyme baturini]